MFKSSLLEALSKVHFTVPLIIFVPVIGFCIYKDIENSLGFLRFVEYFALGLFVWTFVEYIMHRFVFHYMPADKPWALRIHFIFHGVHHDYPSDRLRLVLPPSVSIPLAALFFLLFRAILPELYLWAFFPGFILGYLV